MTFIPWLATAFSLIGIFFNAKKKILCWPLWTAGSILWCIYAFIRADLIQWADAVLWATFTLTNLYGWYSWSGESKEIKS